MDSMRHRVHAIGLESSDIHKRNVAHFLDIVKHRGLIDGSNLDNRSFKNIALFSNRY